MKPSLAPCFFSKSLLVLIAQMHHRAHVDLVEGREHGSRALRLFETAAMVCRKRVIFTRSSRAASSGGAGARSATAADLSNGGGRGGGPLDGREHVGLGDPPVLAGARERRRDPSPAFAASLRTEGASGMAAEGGATLSCFGGRPRARLFLGRVDRHRGVGLLIRSPERRGNDFSGARRSFSDLHLDLAKQRANRHRLAVLCGNRAEHPGGGRGHLDRHLVGLELHQWLINGDSVAGMLEPLADRCFGDRLPERGHADLSHGLILCGTDDGRQRTDDA